MDSLRPMNPTNPTCDASTGFLTVCSIRLTLNRNAPPS